MARYSSKSSKSGKSSEQYAQDKAERASALRESVKASMQSLADEMSQGKSERLLSVLAFSARFHRYSMNNQLAIQSQRASATHVAGYRTWERMGYHVAKGQRGIYIFAPRPYKTEEDGEEVAHITFATVAVFDVSQLNPDELAAKPLPQFFGNLGADDASDALAEKLIAAMRASGLTVEERDDLTGDMQGYSLPKYVAVRAGQDSRSRCNTLAHEWAHELLHQGEANAEQHKRGASVRECHAEATAYTVLAHFGVSSALSSDYLLHWANTPELLLRELEQVQRAASTIIAALETKSEAGSDDEEAAA
jgi:hypothetical protein